MNISVLRSATNKVGWPSLPAVLFGFTGAARSKISDVIRSAGRSQSSFKFNPHVVQMGLRLLTVAIAIGGLPAEAAAQHLKQVAHHRRWGTNVRKAQAALTESAPPIVMRYYGGPKSPMWPAVP